MFPSLYVSSWNSDLRLNIEEREAQQLTSHEISCFPLFKNEFKIETLSAFLRQCEIDINHHHFFEAKKNKNKPNISTFCLDSPTSEILRVTRLWPSGKTCPASNSELDTTLETAVSHPFLHTHSHPHPPSIYEYTGHCQLQSAHHKQTSSLATTNILSIYQRGSIPQPCPTEHIEMSET